MKNLIEQLTTENQIRLNRALENFREEINDSDKLTQTERYTLNRKTPYKKSRVAQVENRLKQIYAKQLNAEIEKVEQVSSAMDSLPNDLVLTINFYKSNTWGYCPKGNDNYGHATSSITGCGYCKESTATAQLLSQNDIILKKMYQVMNDSKNKDTREVLGYGSGHGILPSFSGGVGVSCHVSILENLGYKVTQSGNNTTTVLIISEKK